MAETGYEVSSFLALPFSFFFYPTCIDYLLQAKQYAVPSINANKCRCLSVGHSQEDEEMKINKTPRSAKLFPLSHRSILLLISSSWISVSTSLQKLLFLFIICLSPMDTLCVHCENMDLTLFATVSLASSTQQVLYSYCPINNLQLMFIQSVRAIGRKDQLTHSKRH